MVSPAGPGSSVERCAPWATKLWPRSAGPRMGLKQHLARDPCLVAINPSFHFDVVVISFTPQSRQDPRITVFKGWSKADDHSNWCLLFATCLEHWWMASLGPIGRQMSYLNLQSFKFTVNFVDPCSHSLVQAYSHFLIYSWISTLLTPSTTFSPLTLATSYGLYWTLIHQLFPIVSTLKILLPFLANILQYLINNSNYCFN